MTRRVTPIIPHDFSLWNIPLYHRFCCLNPNYQRVTIHFCWLNPLFIDDFPFIPPFVGDFSIYASDCQMVSMFEHIQKKSRALSISRGRSRSCCNWLPWQLATWLTPKIHIFLGKMMFKQVDKMGFLPQFAGKMMVFKPEADFGVSKNGIYPPNRHVNREDDGLNQWIGLPQCFSRETQNCCQVVSENHPGLEGLVSLVSTLRH